MNARAIFAPVFNVVCITLVPQHCGSKSGVLLLVRCISSMITITVKLSFFMIENLMNLICNSIGIKCLRNKKQL